MDDRGRWPVSIKGVVLIDGRVVLVRNERREWELPGGRMERGESPEQCVVREFAEEVAISVRADEVVDVWVYPVVPTSSVLVVTYGCTLVGAADLRLGDEHDAVTLADTGDHLDSLPMPEGYRRSIRRWVQRTRS